MAVIVDGVEVPVIEFVLTGEWAHRSPTLKDGDVVMEYWQSGAFIDAAQVDNAQMIRCPLCGESFADWGLSAERSHLRSAHGFHYEEGPSVPSAIRNQVPRAYGVLCDANGALHAILSAHKQDKDKLTLHGGPEFPVSPVEGERFYHSGRQLEYRWKADAGRWVSVL